MLLAEIDKDAVLVIDGWAGLCALLLVRIIPDPDFPDPTLEAKAVAYLASPEGDIYYVDVADLNGSNTQPTGSAICPAYQPVSLKVPGEISEAGMPSIDWHASYHCLLPPNRSNLLASEMTRDDGQGFLQFLLCSCPGPAPYLVGGIGEIEIASYGMGYGPGSFFYRRPFWFWLLERSQIMKWII